jgi:hypothetical protein
MTYKESLETTLGFYPYQNDLEQACRYFRESIKTFPKTDLRAGQLQMVLARMCTGSLQ